VIRLCVAALLLVAGLAPPGVARDNDWFKAGAARIAELAARRPIESRAKNVILFIGDGMDITTITAARIYDGQQKGGNGEENQLSFDRFPYSALVKTYNVDAQTPDSAGTATALLSGVKTLMGVIGVDQTVKRGNCAAMAGHKVTSFLERAASAGRATGVVTTTRLTHATPAATYAHVPDRDWEADTDLPARAKQQGCRDIASQFVAAAGITVAFGGGRAKFLPKSVPDPEYGAQGITGKRRDGRNLVAEWRARPGSVYVWNKHQFDALAPRPGQRVLGLFEPSHMHFEADRAGDEAGEPSLAAMTAKAIALLSANPAGFFLMVEGGRIDHAHHAGNAARALGDTVAFAAAVTAALKATDERDTLIIVTADHGHTLSLAGYARRGAPILGLAGMAKGDKGSKAKDGKPYTILGYANGPGARRNTRPDISQAEAMALDYRQQALVPLRSETHGGQDVAAFARGPRAYLLGGVIEQNVLFHLMQYASGL
jgi:alkaline phosphatase